jgi:alpha-glucosidase
VFGMQNARASYDGMLTLRPDTRPYVMTRASYAGGHRSGVTWTGDNSATWNHLRMSTPMLLSLGLGGFAFAGVDLGGFCGSPPPELLTRWLQLGMFNPISRNHSDKGTRYQEPWVDGEPDTAIRRRFVEERYRLMPYIYTLAEEASRTGLPMMRPLFMEFPDAAGGYPLDLEAGNQFMWGSAFLVSPAPYPEALDPYQLILPPGEWYDYWSGAKLSDLAPAKLRGGSGATSDIGGDPTQRPHEMEVEPMLDHLPVHVRAGHIIPRQPLVQHTGETPQGPLELLIYPGPDCVGSVYLDDGLSFGYRTGDFLRTRYRCSASEGGTLSVVIGRREGRFQPWWDRLELVIHGVEQTDGTATTGDVRFDPAARIMRITVPETTEGSIVTIPARLSGPVRET